MIFYHMLDQSIFSSQVVKAADLQNQLISEKQGKIKHCEYYWIYNTCNGILQV